MAVLEIRRLCAGYAGREALLRLPPRRLAQDTEVILLDEPTTYLDVAHQLQVLKLVRALADAGKIVLMVLHDLSHALEHADRIALLQDGRCVLAGTPQEVYRSGRLDAVFGVRVHRLGDGAIWHYFCTGGESPAQG